MFFLDELRQHYKQTKLAILEAVSNKIAEIYPALKDAIEIKRNRIEINSDLCSCYIDLEDRAFKICIDGQSPYCYEDFESVLTDIEDEIASNK